MHAYLTLDWSPPPNSCDAQDILNGPPVPASSSETLMIGNCESLFRRTPSGFADLKKLPSALANYPEKKCLCHFNAFSYSFLVGAKNYDLQIPEQRDNLFRQSLPGFLRTLELLGEFEQTGRNFPSTLDKNQHLQARSLLTRPSARDERRILAELLISGPSTIEQLTEELDLWPDLTDRILKALGTLNLVSRDDQVMSLNPDLLAVSYFLLRATFGLEPLVTLEPS